MKALSAHNRRNDHVGLRNRKSNQGLDLSTVKTSSAFTPRTRQRIFGIQEAPTFYPTAEEFADPIRYIQTIRSEGEKFGIIKIVPPETYKPDFSINTEEFRFKTRIQKLNSMEGETRANVNFLEQLYKFHRVSGRPVSKVPQLDKRPIDLFKLKKQVHRRGGFQQVTSEKKWAEIGRVLGYSRKQCTSMSNALKSAYSRVVLPFENWLANHARGTTATGASSSHQGMKRVQKQGSTTGKENNGSNGSGQQCDVCHAGRKGAALLECDGCDRVFHLACLPTPLARIPKTEWFCVKCLTSTGDDYGFEDGQEYTLKAFQDVCETFKREWFDQKGIHGVVSEEDCEDEFWRLVENPHETCEVEYGADLHSTNHGSGFPSQDHLDKSDPWNLNVIPVLPQSLFTHIKTDISGMMVPWLYIGMCFSAFCWHNEDHFTYSINYMHWGETKTWYGVPGSDTTLFEDAMKKAVPELFEQQPDLLFQLVTMLSPGRLMEENVKVYAVDQRPGQFVVTFPKAYHSGFNHGFNFCEAVNFAPPDWVEFGLECIARYKAFRRQPCFSHDELLITILKEDKLAKTTDWLRDALIDMQRREMGYRHQIRNKYPRLRQVLIDMVLPEEQQQCTFCNCFAYLSQIACACTSKVSCLDHYSELCACPVTQKTLRLRYTDDQISELAQQTTPTTPTPSNWSIKMHALLNSQTAPSLKSLRQLLSQAERTSVPAEEREALRQFVNQISEWVEEASKYVVPKHLTRRHELKEPDTLDPEAYQGKRYQRITELINQAIQMSFDVPEIKLLSDTLERINQFKADATSVLASPAPNLNMCKTVLDAGFAANADVPEMHQLALMMRQLMWLEAAPHASQDPNLTYSQAVSLLDQADQCHISQDNTIYCELAAKRALGAAWVSEAESLIYCQSNPRHGRTLSLDDIRGVLHVSPNVPTEPHLMSAVQKMAEALTDTLNQLATVQHSVRQANTVADRPSETELDRLLKNASTLPLQTDETIALATEDRKRAAWHMETKRLLNVPRSRTTKEVLEDMAVNVRYITSTATERDNVYCVCRAPESGLMIECDVCHEWYHGPCIKITRRQANAQSLYACPICQGTSVPHMTKRPTLQELQHMLDSAEELMFVPNTYSCLLQMVTTLQAFQHQVQTFCRSKTQLGHEDLDTIRQYMRKLEGLSVTLDDETEFLRAKIKAFPLVHSSSASGAPRNGGQHLEMNSRCHCQQHRPDAPTVTCGICHGVYHVSCVHPPPLSAFTCSVCCPTDETPSAAAPPIHRRPIIRLTVRPPAPPSSSSFPSTHEIRRPKHAISHNDERPRKHRRLSTNVD